jgi:hypothetical protein
MQGSNRKAEISAVSAVEIIDDHTNSATGRTSSRTNGTAPTSFPSKWRQR